MIVVTGAAGFIGSNIVAALNAGRDDIVAVDTQDALAGGNLAGLRVQRSLSREELLESLPNFSKAQAVVHMGACSDTTVTDREFVMRNNFEYTRTLWNFCAQHGVRFVYASSAATYGDGSAGYDDAADPKRLKPLNLYGESKQRFDLWALEQTITPPQWAGLKFFNVYGPREAHKQRMASMVFHSMNQIRERGTVRLFKSNDPKYPDGGQKRDFVYVKDAAAAVLHFLQTPKEKCNALFNVGTGKARTFNDLVTATFSAMNVPPKIEYIPMARDLVGKYQNFTEARIEKIRSSGFTQEFHSLENGVKDYVQHVMR